MDKRQPGVNIKWVLTEPDAGITATLSDAAGLHPLIARLMANRGITDPESARSFLMCDITSLSDPALFSGMDRAVARIRKAIADREQIVVYGDYDVDGVTGTALLYLALKGLNAHVESYIPDRLGEGYGLNIAALEKIRTAGTGLVITVDCGISAVREAAAARTAGLDLIITDHHEINGLNGSKHSPDAHDASHLHDSNRVAGSTGIILPDAYAILHPALTVPGISGRAGDAVGCLTGVGIAFKLVQALLAIRGDDEKLLSYLDLVTLGTIADVGRITGENRVMVKHGLEMLSSNTSINRPGIIALKQVTGLTGKKIGVGTIGFTLAPRINAGGRIERADTAFRLFTTDSQEEALRLATMLDTVNRERQAVEEGIWEEARQTCLQADMTSTGAFVLWSEAWHPGVIGIVASRIVEAFYRPAALICIRNGVGKGSARSIPGFDLYAGLAACADLLLGFGGHKYAAGFSIAEENIPAFRERLGMIVREQVGQQGFVRTLSVDGAVTINELTVDLMQELEKLAPFGQGNPEPRLGARGLEVVSSRIVGNNHLKFRVRQGDGSPFNAIAFNRGSLLGNEVRDGARLAAVFTPRLNSWNGSTSVELDIRDIKTDR